MVNDRWKIPNLMALMVIVGMLLSVNGAQGQTTVTRRVVSGSGGTAGSSGHTVSGTLSQTAAGRLTREVQGRRHDVGFWYRAYPPEVVTTVSLPDIETNVGTRLSVDLHLKTEKSRDSEREFLPRRFTARIRFNGTLLRPINGSPDCSYDGDDCVLEISGIAQMEEGTIATLEFITALGNAESTVLEIESFEWDRMGEERITVLREHGSMLLPDVCRVGDEIRLVTSGAAAKLTLWPNPASEIATLEYTPNETGPVDISFVNVLGTEVVRFVDEEAEADHIYRAEFDLTTISAGTYFVVLRMRSETVTRRLVIRK